MRRYNNAKTHRRFLQRLKSVLPGGCCPIVVTDAGLRGSWFRDVSLADQVGACTVTTRRSRCWPTARPTPRGPGYVRDDAPFAAQDPLAALFRYGGQVRRVRCQRANMTCEGAFVARRSVPTSSVALRPSALHSRTAAVAGAPCRRGQSRQSSQASHRTPRSCTPKACGSGRSWGKTKASSDSTRGREARTDRPRDDPRRARPSCGTPKCVHGAVVRRRSAALTAIETGRLADLDPIASRGCPAKRILSTGRPPPSRACRADTSPRRFPGSA